MVENVVYFFIFCGDVIMFKMLISKVINGRIVEFFTIIILFCVVKIL